MIAVVAAIGRIRQDFIPRPARKYPEGMDTLCKVGSVGCVLTYRHGKMLDSIWSIIDEIMSTGVNMK
jgi:hypothetical protein